MLRPLLAVPVTAMLVVGQPSPPARRADAKPSPEALARREGKLKVGDMAADFTLKRPRSEERVSLSQYRGKLPVALVFGSYT